ncbi:MAG TPA: UPF0175 family protein, partial [Chloroflexota bacterium]|nr:UPF0175 family protein [Chloroflexota bacterium]
MKTRSVDLPEDLLAWLRQSRLGARSEAELVRPALAIHLFRDGTISVGKAAELSGEPRATFELLLGEMGVSPVHYDESDYEREWQAKKAVAGLAPQTESSERQSAAASAS